MELASLRRLVAGESDDFEGLRQVQETKNEIFIASVLGALFFALFLAHVLTYAVSWAPYRAPLGMIVLFGVLLPGEPRLRPQPAPGEALQAAAQARRHRRPLHRFHRFLI